MKGRKGQMTIWVIIGIALVIVVLLFFLIRGRLNPEIDEGTGKDPNSYIKECTKMYGEEFIDIILPRGGFIEPEKFKVYNDYEVSYQCFNAEYDKPCVNQHPMLVEEVKRELISYIQPRIDDCILDYSLEMKKRGAEIDLGKTESVNVSLKFGKIDVEINKKISIEDKDISINQDKFNVEITSRLYDFIRIAMEIASYESKYCYFEYVEYMKMYPEFKITKFSMSDSTKIYTITERNSGKEMNIAIRSCAGEPGR